MSIFTLSNRCNSTHIQYSVIFAWSNRCKDAQNQYSLIFALSKSCKDVDIQYSVIFAVSSRCNDAQNQYSVIFALSNRCNDAWPYSVFTWSVNNTRPLWGLPLLLMQLLFATGGLCHGCTNMYTHTYGPLKGPIWSYEVEAVDAVKALTTWNK